MTSLTKICVLNGKGLSFVSDSISSSPAVLSEKDKEERSRVIEDVFKA